MCQIWVNSLKWQGASGGKWCELKVEVLSAGTRVPSGELDDVSGLDEAAQLVPHGDRDAPALVRHLAGAHLVAIFRLGDSSWMEQPQQVAWHWTQSAGILSNTLKCVCVHV